MTGAQFTDIIHLRNVPVDKEAGYWKHMPSIVTHVTTTTGTCEHGREALAAMPEPIWKDTDAEAVRQVLYDTLHKTSCADHQTEEQKHPWT